MIKVIVRTGNVRVIDYVSKKTGQPAQLRAQTAYALTVNEHGETPPFPEKFELLLNKDQQPHAPGEYTLHPSSVFLDRQGRLSVAPRLVPIQKRA